ncbi:MAG: HAD-IIIA family hydrolase [Candidatus Omnitrophica bacterium]|nr:HAD-IIIA family hydrolase [Candidatus Omnitrophota bacterium]
MSFVYALLCVEIIGVTSLLAVARCLKYKFSLSEFFSLAFFCGLAVVSIEFLISSLSGIKYNFAHVLILLLTASIFLVVFFVVPSRKSFSVDLSFEVGFKTLSLLEKIFILGIVFQVIWVVFLSLPMPVDAHDAVANYALKAKMFYFAGGIPHGFFNFSEDLVAHPDYPILLPAVMNWVYQFTGFEYIGINMIMPVIFTAFIILFYSLVFKIFSRTYALGASFLLATIPQVAAYAGIIHTDLVLAAFVSCAFLYFFLFLKNNDGDALLLSALFFGFSLWVKNEAVVFTAAFLAVCSSAILSRERPHAGSLRKILLPVLIVILIAMPWFIVKTKYGVVNSDLDVSKVSAVSILLNIKEIPAMLNLFQQEVFGPKKWNIFWVLFFAALIWKRKTLFKDENKYVSLFLGLSVVGYFIGYMAITGGNLYFYINTTISRFMIHFTGICAFWMVWLIWDKKFLFLDRDGVICAEKGGEGKDVYITRWEDFNFLPKVLEALAAANTAGYECVVISNQQCVGKGYISQPELDQITRKMEERIIKAGGRLAKVYYCPHLKSDGCVCHKPKIGLFEKAKRDLDIADFSRKYYYVGDAERDMEAGSKAGLKTILVLTGKTKRGDEKNWIYKPDYVAADLLEAVGIIMHSKL